MPAPSCGRGQQGRTLHILARDVATAHPTSHAPASTGQTGSTTAEGPCCVQGYNKGGMEGFASGVGKGIIGVVLQPSSGVLDMMSSAAEGASNAYSGVKETMQTVLLSKGSHLRQRLPRAIGASGIVRPYLHWAATGQQVRRTLGSFTPSHHDITLSPRAKREKWTWWTHTGRRKAFKPPPNATRLVPWQFE